MAMHPVTRLSGEEAAIDAKHLDIETVRHGAARARATHYEATTDEEKRLDKKVNRKLDCIVLSLLAIEFIFCGIDKTNVGFVATSSFVKDANLKPDDIPNSLSLFSATYVPFQPIMVILGRRVGVKYFIAFQLFGWGSICMAHAGIKNSGHLIALRLLLGAVEAGFTQLAIFYLSTLYPKYSLAKRAGVFTGMYSVAGAFAGLIAYGLLKLDTGRLHGWQVVFIVEGGFTVLLGGLSLVLLPRSLSTAWFFTPEEKIHAVRRMEIDLAGTQEVADSKDKTVTMRDITDVLRDWKKLLTVVLNITTVFPVTAFTTFLPLVVQGMGYKGIDASLMSVSPFVVGVVGLLCFVWSSDHFRERSIHTVIGLGLGLVGVIVMAVSTDNETRYGFTHVCLAGIFVGGPLIAVWLAGNTPWKGTRSVVLGANGISNIAGVIAGQVYKHKYAPRYETPLYITMGIMAFGAVGLLLMRYMYMLENKKRAKEIEHWTDEDFANEAVSEERRGDQRRTFMYGF